MNAIPPPRSVAMTLGIDPGPKASGWALLDFTVPSAPVWFEHGVTERIGALFQMLHQRELAQYVRLVAVEQAIALHRPEANVPLIGTAWAGGWCGGYAEAMGFNVVAVGANAWRMAFVGRSLAGEDVDTKVKRALGMFVRGFPPRTNVHVRDAAGVACIATRDWRHALRLAQQARNLKDMGR